VEIRPGADFMAVIKESIALGPQLDDAEIQLVGAHPESAAEGHEFRGLVALAVQEKVTLGQQAAQ